MLFLHKTIVKNRKNSRQVFECLFKGAPGGRMD
jgi:hypothetical protein